MRYPTAAEWRRWRLGPSGRLRARLGVAPFKTPSLARYLPTPEAGRHTAEPAGPVVVALDGVSPTQLTSLLEPARLLASRAVPVVVLAPAALEVTLAGYGFSRGEPEGAEPGAVLATTHCSGAGEVAFELARRAGAPYFIVQHGVVTPYAPPLPPGARLLAWSLADAEFWCSGRSDVESSVVGSELLYQAARHGGAAVSAETLTFLGQLHGPELSRRVTLRTVARLARERPIAYRPHPGEVDALSRATHAVLRARGVTVASPGEPLARARGPVVAIFSSGILEAAAAGRPAYAFCDRPPVWVEEVWSRYAMRPLGSSRATEVGVCEVSPAATIADAVTRR